MKTVKFKRKKESVKKILSDKVSKKYKKKKITIADEAAMWESIEKERERKRMALEQNKQFIKSLQNKKKP
jgi:hypothetical protein